MPATRVEVPSIDSTFDLHCLFATVRASVLFDEYVGAHVDLDGSVIADTGLVPVPEDADPVRIARMVRAAAAQAICDAHREIGAPVDGVRVRADVARMLPLSPILEAQVVAEGEALVAVLTGAVR